MVTRTGSDAELKSALIALIPKLRRVGYALTGSRDDADDLCQIALERALVKIHQWQPGTRLDSWLFRIAHNAWLDELRSRKRRGAGVDLEEAGEIRGEDGRDVAEVRLELAKARAVIADLPAEQRAVLALIADGELSYQEAAEALGIPIGTVMSRLFRARKAIAERMTQTGARRLGGTSGG